MHPSTNFNLLSNIFSCRSSCSNVSIINWICFPSFSCLFTLFNVFVIIKVEFFQALMSSLIWDVLTCIWTVFDYPSLYGFSFGVIAFLGYLFKQVAFFIVCFFTLSSIKYVYPFLASFDRLYLGFYTWSLSPPLF